MLSFSRKPQHRAAIISFKCVATGRTAPTVGAQGRRASGAAAAPPRGRQRVRWAAAPAETPSLRRHRVHWEAFISKIDFIPTHRTHSCLAKIKSIYYKKKTSNQHPSFPPCQKSAPNQPQKESTKKTPWKTSHISSILVGFWGETVRDVHSDLSFVPTSTKVLWSVKPDKKTEVCDYHR